MEKIKSTEEKKVMKPRIFLSSTFYDLKYIREDLSHFIRSHGFEPILFEDGDIGYVPGRHLDESCYEALKDSDMVVLIIGGNYGSPASTGKTGDFKKYMSVTRKEFQTAVGSGIPIFTFIDSKVYTEFSIYEANQEEIEGKNQKINFSATKDINVFRFIKEIKSIETLTVIEFQKVADIKEFLEKQWSDMFKNYLESLKGERRIQNLEETVRKMEVLMKKMELMLNTIGKKVLADEDGDEYQNVIDNQKILDICGKLTDILRLKKRKVGKEREAQIDALFCVYEKLSKDDGLLLQAQSEEQSVFMNFFDYCEKVGFDLVEYSDDGLDNIEDILNILSNENSKSELKRYLLSEEYYEKFFDAVV